MLFPVPFEEYIYKEILTQSLCPVGALFFFIKKRMTEKRVNKIKLILPAMLVV